MWVVTIGAVFCKTCRGTGVIRQSQGFFTLERPCPSCRPAEAASAQEQAARSGYVYLLQLTPGIIRPRLRLAILPFARLQRRSLGFHDQRFLRWAFRWRREHNTWKVQSAIPVGPPPPASHTSHGRSLAESSARRAAFPRLGLSKKPRVLRDQNCQALAYGHFEDEPGRGATAQAAYAL
jgi:hypothetical protein